MRSDDERKQLIRERGDETLLYKPDSGKFVPVHDARDAARRVSDDTPPGDAQVRAFHRHRIEWIYSQGIQTDEKRSMVDSILSGLQPEVQVKLLDDLIDRPIPGGVGWGIIYENGKLLFTTESALFHYIVTPTAVGGNSATWLYLTATNRTSKGVEALASYYKQDSPVFTVFDWAKDGDARWALQIPYEHWGDHRLVYPVNGQDYISLYVANSTRLIGGTTWRNEVHLFNGVTQVYDLVYRYDYELASNDDQKPQFWGPIVEVFQKYSDDTNVLGFFDASLWQDGIAQELVPGNTYIRRDDDSFQELFEAPNSGFLVH